MVFNNIRPSLTHAGIHLKDRGFTLIELSIVLVIIALIVGGVLVGQDMIKGAEIRAQVSQLESVSTAANTFRAKYKALPGDIGNPTVYGFTQFGGSVAGNNNGFVDWGHQAYAETLWFFPHLQEAEMLKDPCECNALNPSYVNPAPYSEDYLKSKIGNNYVAVYGGTDKTGGYTPESYPNHFYDLLIQNPVISGWNDLGMTVAEALAIDTKLDDGYPTTGSVVAIKGWGNNANGANGPYVAHLANVGNTAAHCVSNATTPNSYNLSNNGGLLCGVRVRADF